MTRIKCSCRTLGVPERIAFATFLRNRSSSSYGV